MLHRPDESFSGRQVSVKEDSPHKGDIMNKVWDKKSIQGMWYNEQGVK